MIMEYSIKGGVESIPQRVESEVQLIVVLDSLDNQQFAFVDPTYEFPRVLTLIGYLLNLDVEKDSFGGLDQFLKRFLVPETS